VYKKHLKSKYNFSLDRRLYMMLLKMPQGTKTVTRHGTQISLKPQAFVKNLYRWMNT